MNTAVDKAKGIEAIRQTGDERGLLTVNRRLQTAAVEPPDRHKEMVNQRLTDLREGRAVLHSRDDVKKRNFRYVSFVLIMGDEAENEIRKVHRRYGSRKSTVAASGLETEIAEAVNRLTSGPVAGGEAAPACGYYRRPLFPVTVIPGCLKTKIVRVMAILHGKRNPVLF